MTVFARAACAGKSNDLFFPATGQSYVPAKRVCRDCVAKEECLAFALKHELDAGLWGGLTPEERASIA